MVALLLSASAVAQDPNDADREFRRLLARDDAVMTQEPAAPAGEVAGLERAYRRFLAVNSRHARAMIAFGSFLDDTGRTDEAVRWWERAIRVEPRAAHAYNNLANHYGHSGRAADALRYYEKAFSLEPAEPMFRYNWAVTCSLFRNESRAVYGWDTPEIFRRSLEQFRQARDLAPSDFFFAKAYAEQFFAEPNPDWREARVAWKYCLELPLESDDAQRVYASLARVCIRLGDADEARRWLERLTDPAWEPHRRALQRKLDQPAD